MESGKLAELRQMLAAHFSKSELETLCFDLGLDYENLPADTKDALAREMVRSLNRKQRLDQLLARCRELRPQISWPDVPAYVPTDTTTAFLTRESLSRVWKGVEPGKRRILLDKVKKFWVDGVLERTLKERASIELTWQRETDHVDHPWAALGVGVFENTADSTQPDDILAAFEDTDQGLLILGDPGSGKTILLLQLAQRLIERAESDGAEVVPVVLNLVSWDTSRASLDDWVVDELAAKYHIPRNIGRTWLEADALLLLLDGLDEVAYEHQQDCVTAVNQFREGRGLTGLVVSSRTAPYEAIGLQLKFGGAIRLAPLTDAQVDDYLEQQPGQHRQLKQALNLDEEMREMARSPLLLSLMNTVYKDDEELTDSGLNVRVEEGSFRKRLFADYTRQMIQSRGKTAEAGEVMAQLTYLARKLDQHNQTIFLIDQLQPSWLPTRGWQWAYMFLSRIASALVVGFGMWLTYIVSSRFDPEFSLALVDGFTRLFPLAFPWNVLLFEIAAHIAFGVVTALVDIWLFEYWEKRPIIGEKRQRNIHLALICLTVGLSTFAVTLAVDSLFNALISTLGEGLSFFVIYLLVHGNSYRHDIRTAEKVRLSWIGALKGAFVGLVLGLFFQFILMDSGQLIFFLLVFTLLGGFSGKRVETTSNPNQGIRVAVYNGLLAVVIGGTVLGLNSSLNFDGSIFAGVIGFINSGVVAGYAFGLGSAGKHFMLRLMLGWSQQVPWDYEAFLDKGVKLMLLHRVGGGYMFIHRLLQEYFTAEK